MTTDHDDQYPKAGELDGIDEYAARAALDDSGNWFYLLGKDEDGQGHYVKDRDDSAEVAVLNPEQDIIEAIEFADENGPNRRIQSYIGKNEWQQLTEYGAGRWEE